MMFTIVISAIYGVWAIFAPGHIMSTYGTPQELINPIAINIIMLFGVSAWVVAILGWHIRSTVTEETVEKAMSYFTISKGAFKKAHVILKEIAKMVRKAEWHIQASPIAIKGMQNIKKSLITWPKDSVSEVMRMRATSFA